MGPLQKAQLNLKEAHQLQVPKYFKLFQIYQKKPN